MFVANVTPVMLIAGIGTLIQLYPVWRIGSRLPIVMGLSFTFLSAMMTLASKDYGLMIGAVIVGGCIEGLLGLTAKYWRRFVSPIVSACVVTTIGFSLLSTGISSFASSSVYPTGAWQNLLVAVITLAACLIYNSLLYGITVYGSGIVEYRLIGIVSTLNVVDHIHLRVVSTYIASNRIFIVVVYRHDALVDANLRERVFLCRHSFPVVFALGIVALHDITVYIPLCRSP